MAAGTVITCLVISLGFYLSKEAQATADTGTSKIGKINTEFAEQDKTKYSGVNVSGSEVVNAIKKMENENVGVYVVTKSSQDFYGYDFDLQDGELKGENDNTYKLAVENSSDQYINPYALFKGEVIRNSNDVITGIQFVQI